MKNLNKEIKESIYSKCWDNIDRDVWSGVKYNIRWDVRENIAETLGIKGI